MKRNNKKYTIESKSDFWSNFIPLKPFKKEDPILIRNIYNEVIEHPFDIDSIDFPIIIELCDHSEGVINKLSNTICKLCRTII